MNKFRTSRTALMEVNEETWNRLMNRNSGLGEPAHALVWQDEEFDYRDKELPRFDNKRSAR
jgi:hypothetical protein